jgi:hypothetical protein
MENKEKLRVNVIMLPTEKASIGNLMRKDGRICFLYLTSNREIKGTGWIIDQRDKMNNFIHEVSHVYPKTLRIEATTDLSLNLPPIPQSFIEVFVERSSWKPIKEVMIEMETLSSCDGTEDITIPKLCKDGTVIVSRVKDVFTKEEAEALIYKAIDDTWINAISILKHETDIPLNKQKWVEENL